MLGSQLKKGFILPAVLCLLMLMTLLTLTSYEYAKLQYQIAYIFLLHKEAHSNLLFQLNKVEQTFKLNHKVCLFPTKASTAYAHETVDWWKQNACLLSKKPFVTYYVNEKISPNICEQLDNNNVMRLAIHRLTLVSLTQHGKVFVQTVEFEPEESLLPCLRLLQIHQMGRQNLRWG